jgi:tetratricopeptide (TPR) repeat protein
MSERADRETPADGTVIDLARERLRRRAHPGRSPHVEGEGPAPTSEPQRAPSDQAASASTPAQRFERSEVARLLGVSTRRIRAWERAGLLAPSEHNGTRARYSFRALRAARIVRDLARRGVSLARVRALLASLDSALEDEAGEALALATLRVRVEDRRVLARDARGTFELPSWQRVLEFDAQTATVRALPTKSPTREGRTAYEWFLEGCRLEGDEATRARAEAALRKAVELDPKLACAWTNLGALRLAERDASEALACFTRAMECDPDQPEAPYNVGYLLLEQRRIDEAIALLARAVALDPAFADAHFNLAAALDEVGARARALAHWELYLELVPHGPFASIARARLEEER